MQSYTQTLLGNSKRIVAWQRHTRFRKARKEIMRAFGERKADVLLDIGASDGIGFSFWNDLAGKVISLNYYQSLTDDFKQAWPEEDAVTADVRNMPFKNNSVDVMISLETLHFLPDRDARKKSLDEISRVLKPEGIFICSVAVEVGLPALFKYCGRKYAGISLRGMTFGIMFKHWFNKIFDISQYDKEGVQVGLTMSHP